MINNAFALPDGGPVPAAEDLIITSLNAHSFPLTGMSDKRAAQEAIFSYLDSLDTDILCMQEYYKETKANAMATRISAKTGLQYSFRGPYGPLIIFSRYPLKNAEATYFENGVNGFLQVDVQTPKGIVHICNVHLQTNAISEMARSVAKSPDIRDEDTRETIKTMFTRYGRSNRTRTEQSRQILENLSSVKHPIIVSGDFNEVPTSYLYRLFRGKFQDAHLAQSWGLGTTYGGLIPGLRIDYILPDHSLEVLEFERRPCWFSDHDAVRAVIRQ
jgi:endonuclease/exonuclease/phosphatase family metal-dependent hydrolase